MARRTSRSRYQPKTAAYIIRVLKDSGYAPRPYSGRGMFGKDCVGVTLEYKRDVDDVSAITASVPSVDSLGKGVIAYWPEADWPDNEKDTEDNDNDAEKLHGQITQAEILVNASIDTIGALRYTPDVAKIRDSLQSALTELSNAEYIARRL